jgi:hypothetical protein
MKRSILRLELGGVAFTVGLGSALHFAFEWSGRVIPIDPIALAVLCILFVLLALYTPQLLVFTDPVTGGYGIVEQY